MYGQQQSQYGGRGYASNARGYQSSYSPQGYGRTGYGGGSYHSPYGGRQQSTQSGGYTTTQTAYQPQGFVGYGYATPSGQQSPYQAQPQPQQQSQTYSGYGVGFGPNLIRPFGQPYGQQTAAPQSYGQQSYQQPAPPQQPPQPPAPQQQALGFGGSGMGQPPPYGGGYQQSLPDNVRSLIPGANLGGSPFGGQTFQAQTPQQPQQTYQQQQPQQFDRPKYTAERGMQLIDTVPPDQRGEFTAHQRQGAQEAFARERQIRQDFIDSGRQPQLDRLQAALGLGTPAFQKGMTAQERTAVQGARDAQRFGLPFVPQQQQARPAQMLPTQAPDGSAMTPYMLRKLGLVR